MSNPFARLRFSMRNVASHAQHHCTIVKASLMRWGVFCPLVAITITGYAERPANHSSKNSLKHIVSSKLDSARQNTAPLGLTPTRIRQQATLKRHRGKRVLFPVLWVHPGKRTERKTGARADDMEVQVGLLSTSSGEYKSTKPLSTSQRHLTKENGPRTIASPEAGRQKFRSVTVRDIIAKLAHQRSISSSGLGQIHAPKNISEGSKGRILAEASKYRRTKLQKSRKSNLLAQTGEYAMFRAIPPVLKEETRKMIAVAEQSLELGFGLAASLCKRWNRPDQSEYIFSHVLKACEARSKGRGLEATIVLLRSFIQQLANEELQRRLHLRIGRIYYDNGKYGKVVAELAHLQESSDPDSLETLAGLVKGISLIRHGDSKKAMSLLKWVAKESPDRSQRGRAAFLMGSLHLLYNRRKEAKVWLTKVVYELKDKTFSDQALELLEKMK